MNNPLNADAREDEAERAADQWVHRQGYAMTGTEWGAFEQGHLAGSAWARDQVGAPERAEHRAATEAVRELLTGQAARPLDMDSKTFATVKASRIAHAALAAARTAREEF